ncbi:hypothetical protein LNKW23_00610 [Paralimibaculum aggregatum]|uniref:Metalloprotease n=1 Tax=Paralimibaculum aggregatum TaxID=3036245 RepID=A0ABQ6LJK2_9RHOB|nr:neutral zinc metallopeptidase [Limibaculum sp. NKW23]GMG80849.1 hypothetical protein LNKW23_00610 [Limibaculum sp. NKW23]
MVESNDSFRDVINGGPVVVPAPRRRPRFEDPAIRRRKLLRSVGLGAAVSVVAAGLMATAFSTVLTGDDPETGAGAAAAHRPAPIAGPVSETARIADGGEIRLVAPLGLGGRVLPAATEPKPAAAAAGPAPLRGPKVEAASHGAVPGAVPGASGAVSGSTMGGAEAVALPAEEQGAALDAGPVAGQAGAAVVTPPPAVIAAGSNLVWARIFAEIGMVYQPFRLADGALWHEGGCADRAEPRWPAYCPLDQKLYLDTDRRMISADLLAIAHEIGHYLQDALGVAIKPLAGEARDLQADCFAGLWAQRDRSLGDSMAPGQVLRMLFGGQPATPHLRSRIDAYTQGYVARGPMDCTEVALPIYLGVAD